MMKKLYMVIANFVFAVMFSQHIGIGTQSFDDSEIFKVVSTNKGVLLPNIDIPDLNNSSPVTSPAESLLVYNTNSTSGKGYYYWKNNKWNPIIDSSNIYKILGITRSESVISTGGIADTTYNGANTYTIGEAPSAHDWQLIPGLSKTINLSSPNNTISVSSSGILQVNSTGSSLTYISYSIGVFIDNQLAGQKNFIIYGTASCIFNDYNVFLTVNNLTAGSHTIAVYETSRVNFGNASEAITYGSKVSTCNNINNSMDKSILNIQITEK